MKHCMVSLKPVKGKSKYPNYKNIEFKKLFGSLKVDPVLPFSRETFFINSPEKSKGMSISGVQTKLSLKINSANLLEMTQKEGQYILKLSPEVFPFAAENEHCAMLSSMFLGIDTAVCGLVTFSEGGICYITKRFDRTDKGKIHQEDLAQGFGINSEDKYEKSYEAAGKLVHRMSNGKAAVVFDFFKRVVHAYVIGNDDMHLKNISLQRFSNNTGLYYDKLTPNYDCLFTGAFENVSGSGFLALDLLEEERDGVYSKNYEINGFYTGHDFKIFGGRLGLRDKPIITFLYSVINRKTELIELINRSYMPNSMKKRSVSLITERMNALAME